MNTAPHLLLKAAQEPNDTVSMNRRSLLMLACTLVIAALIASCDEGGPAPEVLLEAHWQCDVQRHNFNNLAELNEELERRILDAGLTLEEYDAFKERLSSSAELRREVADEYDAYCRPG